MRLINYIRTAIITLALLTIPVIGMRVSDEWNWTLSDFVIMGALIFFSGLAFEFIASRGSSPQYKWAVGIAALTSFLLMWVNLAVGIIGEPGGPNLMYLGVVFLGLLGAGFANFQPKGMAKTMFVMAIVQMLIPGIALLITTKDVLLHPPGVAGVIMLNSAFAFLFAVSGLLFRYVALNSLLTAQQK